MSTADWDLLNEPGVMETIESQAHKVAAQYDGVLEWADLRQEGYIAVATHSPQFRRYLADDDMGLFAHAVWCDLVDVARKQAKRQNPLVSLDALGTDW